MNIHNYNCYIVKCSNKILKLKHTHLCPYCVSVTHLKFLPFAWNSPNPTWTSPVLQKLSFHFMHNNYWHLYQFCYVNGLLMILYLQMTNGYFLPCTLVHTFNIEDSKAYLWWHNLFIAWHFFSIFSIFINIALIIPMQIFSFDIPIHKQDIDNKFTQHCSPIYVE